MRIIITGSTGQDATFLIDKILRETDADVFACTRNKNNFDFNRLSYLKNKENYSRIKIVELDFLNFQNVFNFINDTSPNYIFNLMGPSSVKSFIENPLVMKNIATKSFENLINSLIKSKNFCNIYHSSSSEMYGYDSETPFDEYSEFKPNSSYAVSKLRMHEKCIELIERYEWPIVTGIMFNHESEFRSSEFLVMNIIEQALKISKGVSSEVTLPSLKISRDWSYAKDISNAIFDLTINNYRGAYIIGSGKTNSLAEITNYIFKKVNLNYKNLINIKPENLRIGEPLHIQSNPSKIYNDIGWKVKNNIFDAIDKMFYYKSL